MNTSSPALPTSPGYRTHRSCPADTDVMFTMDYKLFVIY